MTFDNTARHRCCLDDFESMAHPAPARTEPADSAWRDVLVCALAIAFLMWLGLMVGAFDAPPVWFPAGAG